MTEKILRVQRFGKKLSNAGYPRVARLMSILIRMMFSAEIPFTCEIGQGVDQARLSWSGHLHKAMTDDGTNIFHNVTIEGREKSGTTVIGKNVYIGCGACVLGNVRVGDNARVGANAVVINDVEPGTTVIGIPARVVKRDGVLT